MLNVFLLQWKRLMKQPFLVIMFLGLTVLFVYFMGGAQLSTGTTVPTYSESLTADELDEWLDRLNVDETIVFEATDYTTVEAEIRMNEASFALELDEDTYRFLAGREDERLPVIAQHVDQIFREELRLEEVRTEFPDRDIEVQDFLAVDVSHLENTNFSYTTFQIRTLIGMTFYFTIFTIMFLQVNLIEEKRLGTWNRLIFSPLSKTKMYLGHLFYYYLVGMIQVLLSFFILTNLLGVELGTNYLSMIAVLLAFLFAIVALGLLLSALVPSSQSLQVVIPIVATSMAMLSGAFWPLEIVTNRILLFVAELMPLKHGLQGMLGAIIGNAPVTGLLQPIGILMLMGVLFMGIGINLMERVA